MAIAHYFITVHHEGDRTQAELRSMELRTRDGGDNGDDKVVDRYIDPVIGKRNVLAVMADGSRERCVASKWIGNWQGKG